jgi:replication factor C large subunit
MFRNYMIFGRETELATMSVFAQQYSSQKKKALLLHSPAGFGKTSLVVHLAKQLGFELFEINSSDTRNSQALLDVLKPATTQQSFFHPHKIILIDEVDGIGGTQDRGGVQTLVSIIEQSRFPIICTANDITVDKLRPLLKVCQTLELAPLDVKTIETVIENFAKKQQWTLAPGIAKQLAIHCEFDVRSAIHDLYIVKDQLDLSGLSKREKTLSLEHATTTILKTTDASYAKQAWDTIEEYPDEQLSYLDANVPKEYTKPADLARAYGAISKADIFWKRINKTQDWHYFPYITSLLSAGVACAKDSAYKVCTTLGPSTRGLAIWQANQSIAKKKGIATVLAQLTHTSKKRAFVDVHHFIFCCQKSKIDPQTLERMGFDEEQILYLTTVKDLKN